MTTGKKQLYVEKKVDIYPDETTSTADFANFGLIFIKIDMEVTNGYQSLHRAFEGFLPHLSIPAEAARIPYSANFDPNWVDFGVPVKNVA